MYVMRSKVVIEEVDSQKYSVLKPSQNELIENGFLNEKVQNTEHSDFITQKNTHCLSFGERLLIITANSVNADSINQGKQQHWLQEDIKAGLPAVNIHSTELFIPQMLNLDVLNGINFKKGCYTGQEIVARMHYLGKLKQRMFVCQLNSNGNNETKDNEIKAGDKIYSDTTLKSTAGNIVSINAESALAVLRLDSVKGTDQDNASFVINEHTTLHVNENQPYSLDTKDN